MNFEHYGPCEICGKPVLIPGLDHFKCPTCGWKMTELFKRIYMEEDKRRAERAKLAAAKRKALRNAQKT